MLFFRVRKVVSYSTMDAELLCDVWLALSADFIGMSKGEAFWQQVHKHFTHESTLRPTTCTSFNHVT